MPYRYADVDKLEGSKKVGDEQCVALVKYYANAPYTGFWKQGATVKGNRLILKGTAIATFVDGKYPQHSHNNHAAFYIGQDQDGIWVMDQWPDDEKRKRTVHKRYIPFKGKLANGIFPHPSNNGDAFSIIE